MNRTFAIQLPTFGQNVAAQINRWLKANEIWSVKSIWPIPVARIGALDQHVIVILEAAGPHIDWDPTDPDTGKEAKPKIEKTLHVDPIPSALDDSKL